MANFEVSREEFEKMFYLQGALDAAEKMQHVFKSDQGELLMSEGAGIQRRIDWRRVANECAPEVLVVLAHDGTRNSESFDEFPMYALIPRLGDFVHLQDHYTLSIEEGLAVRRDQVVSALNLLRSNTASIDESKQGNARKLLSGLHKLMLG